MDDRLVLTASFAAYLAAGGLYVAGYVASEAAFTGSEYLFLLGIGYGAPLVALLLVWARSYALGAGVYAVSAASTCWYLANYLVFGDGTAAVFSVGGDASRAYTVGVAVLSFATVATTLVACWLWYRHSPGVRTVVDSVLRRSSSG
ncbi:hypothetical protein [Halovivax limisalsi]|uniref:hypothetical protein n=1 Tax=Halovivax limisalsi TaxID=1453760 RepID=UPI001FFD3D61|nr:hypothetical protein [Halovivax limisalsi]